MCGFAAGAAIVAVSSVMSFAQAQQQADFQKDQADLQAARLENEAQAEETGRVLREEDRKEQLKRTIAEQKVAFGAQGSLIDSNITGKTAFEFAKEQFNDNFDVKRRINDLLSGATSARLTGNAQASASKAKGFQSLLGGAKAFTGGGGSLFSPSGANQTGATFGSGMSNNGTMIVGNNGMLGGGV